MVKVKRHVRVALTRSYRDVDLYHDAYGRSFEAAKDGIPYCSLKRVIGQFYFLELERFRETQDKVLSHSREKYYLNQVVDLSLVVLRFTVAATLGESRHFVKHVKEPSSYLADGRYQKYKKGVSYMKMLIGGVGFTEVPSGRDTIYRAFIPESSWLRYLAGLSYVFNGLPWSEGMGGLKWGKGCDQAIRLYRALSGGMFKDIAIQFDTLVNHFHNGGLLLNKFYCEECITIQNVLDLKHEGRMLPIQKLINTTPCARWNEGTCNNGLRTRSILQGGNYGAKKEEEFKGVYGIYVQDNPTEVLEVAKEKEIKGMGFESSTSSTTVSLGDFIEGSNSSTS